jgi:hypothetical protein
MTKDPSQREAQVMAYFSFKYYRGWDFYVETLLHNGVYPPVTHLSQIHSDYYGNYLRRLAFVLASSFLYDFAFMGEPHPLSPHLFVPVLNHARTTFAFVSLSPLQIIHFINKLQIIQSK